MPLLLPSTAICNPAQPAHRKPQETWAGTNGLFGDSQQANRQHMEDRSSVKKKSDPAKDPEFTFHLIGKKVSMGSSGAVVGAIVAGPVSALLGDALGTAFETAAEAHLNQNTKAPPNSAKLSAKMKPAKKPKSKRRRRGPHTPP
jgi:hypothetical protein